MASMAASISSGAVQQTSNPVANPSHPKR